MAASGRGYQRVYGHQTVRVVGLAARPSLKSKHASDWPVPTSTCDHASFCFLDTPPVNALHVAALMDASLRTQQAANDR